MLKQSQKRTKRAPLSEALMSRQPARWAGWLATMPTGRPSESAEADDEVGGVGPLHLEEVVVVQHGPDDVLHVVGLVGLLRHDRLERLVAPVARILRGSPRRILQVVLGQEGRAIPG